LGIVSEIPAIFTGFRAITAAYGPHISRWSACHDALTGGFARLLMRAWRKTCVGEIELDHRYRRLNSRAFKNRLGGRSGAGCGAALRTRSAAGIAPGA